MIISAKPLLLSLIAYLIFTSTAHAPSHTNMCSSSPDSVPALPWKTRLGLFLASAATDAACRPDGTINRRLLSLLDFRSTPTPNPTNGVKSSDITVDPTRNLWFRVFTPITDDTSLPLLIFFHGGGFAFLSASSKVYDAVCRRFARELPAVVISVNYRLTPEHRFPSQFDDGFDVLKFLDRDHDGMVLPQIADASKIFLIGDSAGANLAHQVALRACREEFRVVKVVGLISIQPFFGGEERIESELRLQSTPLVSLDRTDWLWKVFLPERANRDHEAVNVSGPNAVDISGMEYPATLVFVGGFDPLQDWQRRYYYWLKKSGKEARLVEYPTMIHAFYVSPELPESSQLIAQVKEFMLSKI